MCAGNQNLNLFNEFPDLNAISIKRNTVLDKFYVKTSPNIINRTQGTFISSKISELNFIEKAETYQVPKLLKKCVKLIQLV